MPYTTDGQQFAIWNIGSSISNNYIGVIAIGSGSGTHTTASHILYNEHNRVMITGSPDFSQARKVTFTGDFNSTLLSGLTITEFGLFASGPSSVGSTWAAQAIGSVLFDSTNEAQIIYTIHNS